MSEVGVNFGWDTVLTAEQINNAAGEQKEKREIQDPGNYEFIITKVEKKAVKPGGKYAGAPMAQVHFTLGGTEVVDWLILNTDYKKKIANFLKAVFGAEQPPQGFWDQLVGRKIKLRIDKIKDKFTNDSGEVIEFDKNIIKWYLDATLEHEMGPFEKSEVKVKPMRQTPVPDFGGSATGNSAQQAPINNDLPF